MRQPAHQASRGRGPAQLSRLVAHFMARLLLHSYAGYPVEAIAVALGWKIGTVKSRLARAREQFRRHYVA